MTDISSDLKDLKKYQCRPSNNNNNLPDNIVRKMKACSLLHPLSPRSSGYTLLLIKLNI